MERGIIVKTKNEKNLKFPLLEKLQERDRLRIDERENYHVPDYIIRNLKHSLRPYQAEAIRYFHYLQEDDDKTHVLFHMATGSGKTNVMAALILYLFKEKGMQNFLFLVHTNGIVEKTKENLLNFNSTKYLYQPTISIDGERIYFNEVKKFPKTKEKNTIYIRIDTIQSVSSELNIPRENKLVYQDFINDPVVILGDEAHHFNAYTKANLSKKEKIEKNWEKTLDKLREQNAGNLQLEFTATIDVDSPTIYDKYKNKIIYKYALDNFIRNGYSKRIFRLQANNDDNDKMLNAVLLSQYRKYVAKDLGIANFKPVILFKSARIEVSKEAYKNFKDMIENLSVEDLSNFIKRQLLSTASSSLKEAYEYYQKQSLARVLVELKQDFKIQNIINVNDNDSKGMIEDTDTLQRLNSLESPNNPFRVIFAVAKLSEGWDVLNLYDIVRISENAAITSTATNSEAQLIGRGARYNPFEFNGDISYTRRFDNETSERSLLESLHYHTINDTAYLKNLKKSLDAMQLQVEEDADGEVYPATVKDKFKKKKIYKEGKIFFNETEVIPLENYDSLKAFDIKVTEPWITMLEDNIETSLNDYEVKSNTHKIRLPLDKRYFKKAMAKNRFFYYKNLKNYFPTLNSINQLLEEDESFKYANIQVELPVEMNISDITPENKLKIIQKYLKYVEDKIRINFRKERGTNRFIGYPIRDVVKDYVRVVKPNFNKNTKTQNIEPRDMSKKDWFVYDFAIVNDLEDAMINWLANFIDPLRTKYKEVYLIRIDEQNTNLSLHAFKDTVGNYKGFIPDFLLYLDGEDYGYQIFIEPKGPGFLIQDQWKEDLLQSLNTEEIELVGETDDIRLYGLKFYVPGDGRNVEKQLAELVFEGQSFSDWFKMT